MASPAQFKFLASAYAGAKASGHIFPSAAACEACVETAWGTSQLFIQANNVFGQKVPVHPNLDYQSIYMPTNEIIGGRHITEYAKFVRYPTIAESFEDRMATLDRLQWQYPHYAAALAAKSPEEYLTEVSVTWSTDPDRAATCIEILHAHGDILGASVMQTI